MSRNVRLVTLSLALAAAGCEDLPPPPTKAPAAEPAPAPRTAPVVKMAPPAPIVVPTPSPPAAPTPAGMEDPFGRLAPTSARNLDAGWRAMRKKDWGASRDAFHAVVLEHPDYVAARFQELRATVLDGDLAAVPALWRELLARDFVGYADKLDKAKEMKSLRASPQWTQLEAIRAEARSAYGAGLDRGLFFVARTRGHLGPKFDGDDAKLELDQEAYHFDPATRRIRRLSDTGGHVVAVHRDGEHRQLVILTARALKKTPAGDAFATPEAMALSLDTLERSGPLTADADAATVDLCFSGKGEPVWSVLGAGATVPRTFTLDATGTALVGADDACDGTVASTVVTPTAVEHRRPEPEGVTLSDDGMQLVGVDGDRPVRASEAIRAGSLSWSPGKKRFVYTGRADRCDPQPPTASLYVWEAGRKKAARVGSGPSPYETQWLDDDHLAYESGLGVGRLTVHDFAGGQPLTLKAPAGAGLYGMPAMSCDKGVAMAK